MKMPLELRRFLDPRDARSATAKPIRDAVNIPLAEIRTRTHELPPRNEIIAVAADIELFRQTSKALCEMGRCCTRAADLEFHETPTGAFGRLWRPSAMIEFAAGALSPGRALDLGCGTGRDAVYLAAAGWRVVAVDRLPDAIHRGRLLAAGAGISADSVDWICAEASDALQKLHPPFDLIAFVRFFSRDVLEHGLPLLAPAGGVILETFAVREPLNQRRPETSEFELRRVLRDFEFRQMQVGNDERGRSMLRAWAERSCGSETPRSRCS